jgi:arylsulfatase A-like enzyme
MARPFRFTLILVSAGLGTALAAFGGWHYARASAPLSGPIVLISVDTLRADHLPAYGYERVKTPAIDALASDGVVFDRAYAHAPQTLPAHVSLLSGRLPFETGVRDDLSVALNPGERLLPQMLRERGYTTGGVISAPMLGRAAGFNRGFDFFDAEMPARAGTNGAERRDGSESERIAERWLDTIGTSRSFLFLHLYEPHTPYDPPARFADYAPYDAEIAYVDEIVGRLIKYLKARQLYEKATIVLAADHGEGLGDHGEQEHGLFVYEEAVRVPLIVKQEGNAGAGRHVADPVQHIDLVPTVLDLVKAPISGGLRGHSLKPLLDGGGPLPERVIYSEEWYGRDHFGWSPLTTATDGRYRFIRAPREELYDLQRDPHQRDNLAERALPPAAAAARQKLAAALDTLAGPVPSEERPDPKDRVAVLESYRRTLEWAAERNWTQAIAVLQQMLRDDPTLLELWRRLGEFSARIDRFDLALDADWRVVELQPLAPDGYIQTGRALLRLRRNDEARECAQTALDVATMQERRARAAAHELLARIALAEGDADEARAEGERAQQAEPLLPMTSYIDARLLYDQGQYADAAPLFDRALADLRKSSGTELPDLHFAAADTMMRIGRARDAEREYNAELRAFPENTAARAGLAALYQSSGDSQAAERIAAEMTRVSPTPDSYAAAAKLWQALGNTRQANAVRAEARRRFHRNSELGMRN